MPALQDDLSCIRCQYNLRGLDPAGRCPECGASISESVPASTPEHLSCITCGYSLRGLNVAGRCPECGTPVSTTLAFEAAFPKTIRLDLATQLRRLAGSLLLVIAIYVGVAGAELGNHDQLAGFTCFAGFGVEFALRIVAAFHWRAITSRQARRMGPSRALVPAAIVDAGVTLAVISFAWSVMDRPSSHVTEHTLDGLMAAACAARGVMMLTLALSAANVLHAVGRRRGRRLIQFLGALQCASAILLALVVVALTWHLSILEPSASQTLLVVGILYAFSWLGLSAALYYIADRLQRGRVLPAAM